MSKNFEKYDLFYNSNNYLSLVYAILGNTAKIINYNGTVYTLDISKKTYEKFNFNVGKISVKDFILQFPEVYLNDTNVDSIIYNLKKEFNLITTTEVSIPDLAEIKQKFPIGCTLNNKNLNKYGLYTDAKNVKVTENAVFSREGDNWSIIAKEQGNWTVYYNGHYADIITMESKIDPPYLLDIQNIFPIGTIFNNANLGADRTKNEKLFIKDNNFEFNYDSWFYKNPNGVRYVVWKEGQYATILGRFKEEKSLSLKEQETDAILIQARMKFRKGVKFAINNLYPDNDTLYEIAQEPIFIRHSDGDILVKCVEERNHIPRQVVVYCGRKKEWATIMGYLYDVETSGIGINPFVSEANVQKIAITEAMPSTILNIDSITPLTAEQIKNWLSTPLTWGAGTTQENFELPIKTINKSEFTIEPMREIPIKEVSLDHIKFTIEKLK